MLRPVTRLGANPRRLGVRAFRLAALGIFMSANSAFTDCASLQPQGRGTEPLDAAVFRLVVTSTHAHSGSTFMVDPRPLRVAPPPLSDRAPEVSDEPRIVKVRRAVLRSVAIPVADGVAQWNCALTRGNPAPPGAPVRAPATAAESIAVNRQLERLARCGGHEPFLLIVVGTPQRLPPNDKYGATFVVRVLEFAQDQTKVYDAYIATASRDLPRIVRQEQVSAAFL